MSVTTDRRFLITDVSWRAYEILLEEIGDRNVRMAFDGKDLEFMSPGGLHDRYKSRCGRLIEVLTEELEIPIDACGSTTLRRGDVKKGLEPDEGYYIRNEPLVRGKLEMNLEVDPPPDLAIEIDITNSSVDRQGIYASLGIPEIWRFDGDTLRAFRLGPEGKYELTSVSPSFPYLPLAEFARFLDLEPGEDSLTWIRRFRAWIRERVIPLRRQMDQRP